jgi:hypothetical protein
MVAEEKFVILLFFKSYMSETCINSRKKSQNRNGRYLIFKVSYQLSRAGAGAGARARVTIRICGSFSCRNQCCGSGMFNPDPGFGFSPSQIRIRDTDFSENLNFLTQNCCQALENMIRDVFPDLGSEFVSIPDQVPRCRGQKSTGF